MCLLRLFVIMVITVFIVSKVECDNRKICKVYVVLYLEQIQSYSLLQGKKKKDYVWGYFETMKNVERLGYTKFLNYKAYYCHSSEEYWPSDYAPSTEAPHLYPLQRAPITRAASSSNIDAGRGTRRSLSGKLMSLARMASLPKTLR